MPLMPEHIIGNHQFTVPLVGECDIATLNILVKPDTDLDGPFKAWCRDEEAYIRVHGWLFSFELEESAADVMAAIDTFAQALSAAPVATNLEAEFHKRVKKVDLSGGWRQRQGHIMGAFREACDACGLLPTGERKQC